MKFRVDDREYDVPFAYTHKLLGQGLQMGLDEYDKLKAAHMDWAIGAKAISRHILEEMEVQAGKTHGPEVASHYKPPRKSDPNIYLATILLEILEKVMAYATFSIDTEAGSQSVTAFNLTIEGASEEGGRLGADRDTGERENYSTQVP